MAEAQAYPDLVSVKKVQEIPVVNTVSSSVSQLYSDVKNSNRVAAWSFIALETSVLLAAGVILPLLNLLKGPVETLDVFVCMLIDGAKSRFPVFFKPTAELTKSASKAVVSSSITQATLYGVDKVLLVAQKSVTMLPDMSVEGVAADAEDKDKTGTLSALTSSLEPLRNVYSAATYPLKTMGVFFHSQRRKVRRLLRRSSSSRGRSHKRASPRKPSPPQGLIERVVSLPVRALNWIGVLAERRTILKLREDPDLILTSPKARALAASTDDAKNYLEQLDNLEDYISEEDPDYEPGDSDSYSDSEDYLSEEESPNVSHEINSSPEKSDAVSPSCTSGEEGSKLPLDQVLQQVSALSYVSVPNSGARHSRAQEKNSASARVVASNSSQTRLQASVKVNAKVQSNKLAHAEISVNPSKVKTVPAGPLVSATSKTRGNIATSKSAPPNYMSKTASSSKKVASSPVTSEKPKAASPNRQAVRSVKSPEATKRSAVGTNMSKSAQNGS